MVLDMLEIGIYVYCADQSVSRGGDTWRGDGKNWIRHFTFNIPVRNPQLWNNKDIKSILTDVLGFLSDDFYEFNFDRLEKEIPLDQYFDFHEES
jgi:hypothetical protein